MCAPSSHAPFVLVHLRARARCVSVCVSETRSSPDTTPPSVQVGSLPPPSQAGSRPPTTFTSRRRPVPA
eukprot:10114269-Alexandrium_andersonii.AAC.1